MPSTKTLPVTDDAATLRDLTGDDATATFEDDPNFENSNPGGGASSENVAVQRDTDDLEDSDEEEEDADLDDDELEDDELDEDEDDEDEYEDDDEEDSDEDEDDSEDDDLDDEDLDLDDADDEDDTDEVAAAGAVMRADGLLGQEDEQEDAAKHRDRVQGDAARAGASLKVSEPDQDEGDVEAGVDEDALDDDDIDTDKVAAAAHMAEWAAGRGTFATACNR